MPDNDAGQFPSGRTRQGRQLLDLLESARCGAPVQAVITGAAGMGKTALARAFLGHPDAAREGTVVLNAAGALWETHRDFGVVEQLLAPCPGTDTGTCTGPDTGTGTGPGPDAGAGTSEPSARPADGVRRHGDMLLAAFNRLAANGRMLIVWVDDLHLADVPSQQALLYALRRVGPLPLLTIVCLDPDAGPTQSAEITGNTETTGNTRSREESKYTELRSGLTALTELHRATAIHLQPLTADEVAAMWDGSAGAGLPASAARMLVEHTGGSPALILPLLEQFPVSVWSGSPETFPAPDKCVASVAATLRRLPAAAAALTEAAAVLGIRSRLALAAELAGVTDAVAALDPADAAGLLRLSMTGAETWLAFPQPVLRAAVYGQLGPGRRAALHTAAAGILPAPVQQLKHRAAAALLPDASLAAELRTTAEGFAASGAWHRAADAFAQAARLSPLPADREALMIRAVDAMVGAGELPRAVAALDALEAFAPGPGSDAVRGYLAILRGRPAQAEALLQKAWTAVDPASGAGTAGSICQRQVLHALARFHGKDLVMWAERARRHSPPGSPPAVEAQAIEGLGLGAMGRYAEADQSYRDADRFPEAGAQRQRTDMGKGWLHLARDRVEEARAELAGAVPTEFAHGSQRISLWAQGWLARADFALGAWDDALQTVDNAVGLQEESGIELLRPLLHWSGAQIHALRGNWDAAEHHLERGAAAADSYATMLLPSCLARAQVAETKADYDGVIRALLPVLRMQRDAGIDEPGFWPWQDHYANALVMVGRVAEADAFLAPHEELAASRGHRSTLARLAYVRGRIQAAAGDLEAARSSFQGGLARLDGLPMPYARARVKFAYGRAFRRAGKRREAAAVLAEARELFAVLGAQAYVDRCSREMRASGVSSGGAATVQGTEDLTEQEKAVAALVASGLSNKEAAAELYVSVKTVQYHLTRIYAKLRITSRSGLAAAYPGRLPETGT